MREITSKDNRIYKTCEQLSLKKYRDKLGRYLIEGENLIEEALKTGCRIETLLVRRGYNKVPDELEDKAFVLDEKLFDRLAQTETSQGVHSFECRVFSWTPIQSLWNLPGQPARNS